ncbi:MAG: hypothetical protein ACREID_05175, partial [Planctomycetota bacterium]
VEEIGPFLDAFVEGMEARYRHFNATGESESLEELLVWAHALCARTTGTPLPPPAAPLDYPFVGKLVDATVETREPLVALCAARGVLLLLGQLRGGPPEALVARVVERTGIGTTRVRGTEVEREVVTVARPRLTGYQEWAGQGDVAGIALHRVVVLDRDAVASWEGALRRRVAALAPRRDALLAELALEDAPVTSVEDPAGVADRLLLAGPLALDAEVRVHEDAHLVDALRHLPVGRHPLRNFALAFRRGFSGQEILAYLERNAQLAAIAEGPAPLAALATCCATLGGRGPHASGYEEIVRGFVLEIAARPERYPEIDGSRVIVQQLHRLPEEKVRALARALSLRWGVARP